MPELRIIGNTIEMDGEPVADIRFMPATQRTELEEFINEARVPDEKSYTEIWDMEDDE